MNPREDKQINNCWLLKGTLYYQYFPFQSEGLSLKFGGCRVYRGIKGQDLKQFENIHREMRDKIAAWKQGQEIGQ